jgi:hypothetical protein
MVAWPVGTCALPGSLALAVTLRWGQFLASHRARLLRLYSVLFLAAIVKAFLVRQRCIGQVSLGVCSVSKQVRGTAPYRGCMNCL